MANHAVDPETITVGQWVQFVCPKCEAYQWRKWLQAGNAVFGEVTCFKHDQMPLIEMEIRAVRSDLPFLPENLDAR